MSENAYITRSVNEHVLDRSRVQRKDWVKDQSIANKRDQSLSRFEKISISASLFIVLSLIILIFKAQIANFHLQSATTSYQNQTVELQQQTDSLLNYLSDQYNYHEIKAEAEANGMTIRPGSIREIINE